MYALTERRSKHIVNQLEAAWSAHEARRTIRTQPSCNIRKVTWTIVNPYADAAFIEKAERCGERRVKIVDDLFIFVALTACIFSNRQAMGPEKHAISGTCELATNYGKNSLIA